MLNDAQIEERITAAFEWLTDRAPTSEEIPDSTVRIPPQGRAMPWMATIAAVAVVAVVAIPILMWRDSGNEGATPPVQFVTSIPGEETLLLEGSDFRLYGFLADNDIPCLRAEPLDDSSLCSSPELWAVPGVLSWQGYWGASPDAWVYGYIRGDVATVEFQFQRDGVPDPAAPGALITTSAHPDLGWGVYLITFDADQYGLFTVVTAYDAGGAVLGRFDLRGQCNEVSPETLERDHRLRDLCTP